MYFYPGMADNGLSKQWSEKMTIWKSYLDDCNKDIKRIEEEAGEWYIMYGRMVAIAKYYATLADEKARARRNMIIDPKLYVREYLTRDESPSAIYDLLSVIHDQVSQKEFDGQRLPAMDDLLAEFDEFVSDYENSPERQRERDEDAAERKADEMREAAGRRVRQKGERWLTWYAKYGEDINLDRKNGRMDGHEDGIYLVWGCDKARLAHELSHVILHVFEIIGIDPREAQ